MTAAHFWACTILALIKRQAKPFECLFDVSFVVNVAYSIAVKIPQLNLHVVKFNSKTCLVGSFTPAIALRSYLGVRETPRCSTTARRRDVGCMLRCRNCCIGTGINSNGVDAKEVGLRGVAPLVGCTRRGAGRAATGEVRVWRSSQTPGPSACLPWSGSSRTPTGQCHTASLRHVTLTFSDQKF